MRWSAAAAALGALVFAGGSVSALSPQAGGVSASQRAPREFRIDPQLESRLDMLALGGSQLGLTFRDLDAAAIKKRKLSPAQGVLVETVQPGGPADKSGIRAGDLISEFGDEHVRSVSQLRRLLGETPDGLAVKVGVVRDGRRLELSVTPGPSGPGLDDSFAELLRSGLGGNLRGRGPVPLEPQVPRDRQIPREPQTSREPQIPREPFEDWSSGAGRLGVVAQDMTPQLADYFGAKEGVLVSSVTEASPAARAGLRAGDVVTAVGGAAVKTATDLARAIRAIPDGQEVAITVVRNRQPLSVKIKLGGSQPREQDDSRLMADG
jgi:membrane-associated protease RseP (regulator of RpoE activity)